MSDKDRKNNVFDANEAPVPPTPGSGIDKDGRPIPPPPVHFKNSARQSLKKKIGYIALGIIAFIILFLVIVNCSFKLPVKSFYDASGKNFKIPDIGKGFIPQGISYDDRSGDFYLTGYMKDESASPIYIVDKKTKKLEQKVFMSDPSGDPLTIHAGGISYYNGMVYVAGAENSCLYVYNPADIRDAQKGDLVSYVATVDLTGAGDDILAAFTTVHDGLLYVGEFYRKPNYLTNELHKVEISKGSNNALMVGLSIDNNYKATPVVAYSIPDKVQGCSFRGEDIYFSTSYGISFSKIYRFDKKSTNTAAAGSFSVFGNSVPLYILESNNASGIYKFPSMVEEIDILDDQMYVLTESASDMYVFGKLIGTKKVFTTDLNLLDNN